MPFLTAIALLAVVPTAALALTLFLVSLRPKRELIVNIAVAILGPLLALNAFIAIGYYRWNWAPFSYGSVIPHFIAAILSLVLLGRAISRVFGPVGAKVLVGALGAATWLGIWLVGTFFTDCAMGDCI